MGISVSLSLGGLLTALAGPGLLTRALASFAERPEQQREGRRPRGGRLSTACPLPRQVRCGHTVGGARAGPLQPWPKLWAP